MVMNLLAGLLCLALVGVEPPTEVSPQEEPPISLAAAREAFAEARTAAMADNGALWGRSLDGPMLFVDRASRFVVANQADEQGLLSGRDGVFVGTLPPEVGIANTATTWAGVHWTMLMWPLPSGKYSRARLLMHECFHRIQAEIGLPAADAVNSHLDTAEGRISLRLEWRALAEALIRRGDARRRAIEDALIFRAFRRDLLPSAAAQERALELNEGLAEYTGVRLCGWPAWILADRAAVRLEFDEHKHGLARTFAYASGPAYGILIDETGTGWRDKLGPQSDLGAILAQALDITLPGDLSRAAHQRAAAYDGPAVISEENELAEARREMVAQQRARLVDGPLLILPCGPDMRYTFNPNAVMGLDESTLYGTVRVSDAWGILEVSQGALMTRNDAGSVADFRVPAPSDPAGRKLDGDGWMLTLNEGWKLVPASRPGDYTLAREKVAGPGTD